MKIKCLNLVSYGKYKNRIFELKDGLNVFYGENGSGKSTIASALKTFLYKNMKGDRKYKKNYIPLDEQQGVFDVEFETDDGNYETCVTLGKTAAKSLSTTLKKPLNTVVEGGDKEVGELFLKTCEDMYDSVCFINDPSDFMKVSSNEPIVTGELSGTVCTGKGSSDIITAVERLESEINQLTRKTATGAIYPLSEQIDELTASISKAEEMIEEEKRINLDISMLESSLSAKKEEYKQLETEKLIYEEYSEYEEYLEYKALKEELEELVSRCEKEEMPFVEMTSEDEKRFLALELSGNDGKPERKSFPFWIVFIISALLLGVAGAFFRPAWVFAGIFLALGIFFARKSKENIEINAVNNADKTEYERLCDKYGVKCYDEYVALRTESFRIKNENELLEEKIRIKSEKVCELEKKVKKFETQPQMPVMVCDFQEKIKKVSSEISDYEKNIAVLKERAKNIFNNFPDYDSLLKRREELREKKEALEYELEICRATLDVMELTAASYKESYLPELIKETEKILSEAGITDAEKLLIDENLNISVRDFQSPFLKGNGYISSGISDSFYFALRLAVYELAFREKERPPLILDDPFIRMDDKKFMKWVCYLNEKSSFQTIFFTSKQRIFEIILEKDTINRL